MKFRSTFPVVLFALGLFFGAPPAQASSAPSSDVDRVINEATTTVGVDTSWDDRNASLKLVENLRGLATIILLIALVIAAMSAGITGKTTMAIFVAVGAIVLFGGFWIVLLIVEGVGGRVPPSAEVTIEGPDTNYTSVISPIIKDFIGSAINMLTTATMPFLMIYGFWLSLGVASGESGGGPGAQVKNYVLGAIVAIGASIFTQIFFRW